MSTTNNDVDIPTKINFDIPNNINVNIHQNKNVNIPSNNNNQLSVPNKVPLNKESNPVFNCDSVNEHVSPSNSDVGIPTKIKDVDIPQNVNDNEH